MQASIACLVLAGAALPWDPLLSGELLVAAGVLGSVAAMPAAKPSTNATRVNITDGVPGPAVRSYITIGPVAVAVNGT
jgi:hypothetical protein